MRIVLVRSFGGPEVLAAATAPDPVAGPGQAVVRVAVADVLFFDAIIRYGLAIDFVPLRPPYVPGNGVAGQVTAAGDGVDPDWIGRRVVAHTGGTGGGGGYAEQALVPAAELVPVPAGLGLPAAAALLHDGATALGLAESTGIRPGEWVLVVGAGGGLGLLLVQLARAAGAHVIAAARGSRKLDQALELGAEVTADYSEPGWPQNVLAATAGIGPDVVFDGAGTQLGQAAFTITADGGRFSAHGSPSGGFALIDPGEARRRGISVRGIEQVQFTPDRLHALTTRALAEAAAGRIQPVIGQTFPLDHAADAHTAIETRSVTGKTLLLTG
jgi:NADPH2:quinone reductase